MVWTYAGPPPEWIKDSGCYSGSTASKFTARSQIPWHSTPNSSFTLPAVFQYINFYRFPNDRDQQLLIECILEVKIFLKAVFPFSQGSRINKSVDPREFSTQRTQISWNQSTLFPSVPGKHRQSLLSFLLFISSWWPACSLAPNRPNLAACHSWQ